MIDLTLSPRLADPQARGRVVRTPGGSSGARTGHLQDCAEGRRQLHRSADAAVRQAHGGDHVAVPLRPDSWTKHGEATGFEAGAWAPALKTAQGIDQRINATDFTAPPRARC